MTVPVTRHFKTAHENGQVQLNYDFAKRQSKIIKQLFEEDNEKFMENIQFVVLPAESQKKKQEL